MENHFFLKISSRQYANSSVPAVVVQHIEELGGYTASLEVVIENAPIAWTIRARNQIRNRVQPMRQH